MCNTNQRPGMSWCNPEFLLQLTPEPLFNVFPLVKLAAREFPQASLVYMRRSLAEQYPALIIDNSGHSHMNTFRSRTHCTTLPVSSDRDFVKSFRRMHKYPVPPWLYALSL